MPQIISQDTEWASGSVHVLADTLQVAFGATLKIRPGAIVTGGAIEVLGVLDATGNTESKVTFNNVNLSIVGEHNRNARIDLDYVSINGGSFLYPNGNAGYGTFSLTNSEVRNIPYSYVWYPTSDVLIRGNLFDGFGGFSVGSRNSVVISHNTFINTNPPYPGDSSSASATITSWNSGPVIVDQNNFLDVGRPTLALPKIYNNANITATRNYFGTTDANVIAGMIFDKSDNLQSANYISFSDFLSSPDPLAPLPRNPPTGLLLAALSDTGVKGDRSTHITTPTVIGSGERGATVTLLDGNTVVGSSTVASSGSWSITTTTLNAGAHTLIAKQTDAFGNLSRPSVALDLSVTPRSSSMRFIETTDRAAVARLYQAAFDRAPDASGLDFWTGSLARGVPLLSVASSFLASPEAKVSYGLSSSSLLVSALYGNVLGRLPDEAGFSYWTGILDRGAANSAQVLISFSESIENKVLTPDAVTASVARLYHAALGRAPEASGLSFWVDQLVSGKAMLIDEASFLATSPEFVSRYGTLDNMGFVDQLYKNVLGRSGEASGSSYWANALTAGASRGNVVTGFSESSEYKAQFVTSIAPNGIILAS